MNPKEKAEELVFKYEQHKRIKRNLAKQFALIAVDEIIKAHIHNEGVRHLKWWGEVKQELEKL